MTRTVLTDEAISLLVRSVNILLTAENRPYRVTADDIIMTRRDGVTFIALRETGDAADWRRCARPYSTMHAE